jgi:Na+-transporting methylmalonyl-CoA/oxaloacetate decarboxylase gamma subunit
MDTVAILQALEVMWKGMVSIFTVIILLTIIVYLLGKFAKDNTTSDTTTKTEN